MAKLDLDALADVACRLSWFAHDHLDLVGEVDLNPVIVHSEGISIVDALIVRLPDAGGGRPTEPLLDTRETHA